MSYPYQPGPECFRCDPVCPNPTDCIKTVCITVNSIRGFMFVVLFFVLLWRFIQMSVNKWTKWNINRLIYLLGLLLCLTRMIRYGIGFLFMMYILVIFWWSNLCSNNGLSQLQKALGGRVNATFIGVVVAMIIVCNVYPFLMITGMDYFTFVFAAAPACALITCALALFTVIYGRKMYKLIDSFQEEGRKKKNLRRITRVVLVVSGSYLMTTFAIAILNLCIFLTRDFILCTATFTFYNLFEAFAATLLCSALPGGGGGDRQSKSEDNSIGNGKWADKTFTLGAYTVAE